jgi:thiamine-monophosphate kinase
MRESDLLANIFARSADLRAAFPSVVVGPGDDCAAVRTAGGDQLLLKVDQVVEGRHFTPGTPADLIARKAVARAVSDIAATGGRPLWGLGAGVLPPGYGRADELCARLAHWGRHFGAPLVGGDIATGPTGCPLMLSITIVGSPHATRGPALRSTAKPGDEVWVTGRIGGSLAGGRHLTFEPRVQEGRWLCDTLGANLHAMMDISDGLGRDAGRMAAASGVRIVIEGELVPLHADAKGLTAAVGDGEDYELLFCAEAGAVARAAGERPVLLTRIGRVETGSGCVLAMPGGRELDAAEMGWEH